MKKQTIHGFTFLLSALCFYFSLEWGWLAWIAPLPIFLVSRRLSSRLLFIGATLSYWAGSLSWWSSEYHVLPLPIFLFLHLMVAIIFALIVVWANKKSVLIFPVCWTAFDFLFALLSPHATWGSLAYTQTDILPIMQNASIFGIYGVTFLVCLFPAAIMYILQQKNWKRTNIAVATSLTLILLIGYTWGYIRINAYDEESTVTVGLAAANQTIIYTDRQERNLALIKAYGTHVTQLKNEGAQIVVLPEKLLGLTSDELEETEKMISEIAIDNQIALVIGLKLTKPDGIFNTAWVFSPSGERILEYHKIHLLTGSEDEFTRGHSIASFNSLNQNIGVTICKDMDYPETIRKYGKENIGLMLVPAKDWKGAEKIHSRMAVVRGIENGFAIARSTNQGLVTVSDKYGKVLAEQSTFNQDEVVMTVKVPVAHQKTIYSHFGNWFGWLMLLISSIMIIQTIRRKLFLFHSIY